MGGGEKEGERNNSDGVRGKVFYTRSQKGGVKKNASNRSRKESRTRSRDRRARTRTVKEGKKGEEGRRSGCVFLYKGELNHERSNEQSSRSRPRANRRES